jgi:hypothetical protein
MKPFSLFTCLDQRADMTLQVVSYHQETGGVNIPSAQLNLAGRSHGRSRFVSVHDLTL